MCVYFSVNRPIYRFLLLIPFLQVELALNKATSKSCTHACIYVTIRPHVNSKREIIKTSHAQNFFLFFAHNVKNE